MCVTLTLLTGFLWLHSVCIAASWIIHIKNTRPYVTSAIPHELSLWIETCRERFLSCFFLCEQSRPVPNQGYRRAVCVWLQSVCIAALRITHIDTHTEHWAQIGCSGAGQNTGNSTWTGWQLFRSKIQSCYKAAVLTVTDFIQVSKATRGDRIFLDYLQN